jgi:hypothetical protein
VGYRLADALGCAVWLNVSLGSDTAASLAPGSVAQASISSGQQDGAEFFARRLAGAR